jgi:pyruvate carboxylase
MQANLTATHGRDMRRRDVLSHLIFPKVFEEFEAHRSQYSDVSPLPTSAFFYGLDADEEIAVEIERGKTLIIKLVGIGDANRDGMRTVFFELNGQPRRVTIPDRALTASRPTRQMADPKDSMQVGASMPGVVTTIAVQEGDHVVAGQKLLALESMKMETAVQAERDGVVGEILVEPGVQLVMGELMIRLR